MLFQDSYTAGLIRALKFNRFLSLIIGLNLIFYSAAFGWISLLIYLIISELFIKIARNNTLSSKKICSNLFNTNIFLTTIFLFVIAFVSGNKDYAFLSVIPLFQSALYRKPLYLLGIIFASSTYIVILTGSLQSLISFITIMGVFTFLGLILMKTLNRTHNKADYLHNMATTDALTGLINRREFDKRMSEEFSRAKRHKSPLSLALFDIDFFKKINDTYGHNAGDAILKELGGLIAENTRNCDIVARYGGEEFALILPETAQAEAFDLMDRLRQTVESGVYNKAQRPIKFTISIGVAQLDTADSSPTDFIERTDKALYKAKQGGRNRVEKAPFGLHFVARKRQAV